MGCIGWWDGVTYASCPWGCEGLWVEQAHAVTKALVLHSEEAFAETDDMCSRNINCMLWMNMRRGDGMGRT